MASMVRFLVFCLAIALPLPVAYSRAGAINHLALAPPLDPLSPIYELTSATFNDTLASALVPWAIVEFYAHWCGACKHYKPHYERVAKLFNGPGVVHPGEVYLARVDCANNINQDECLRFGVGYYPTLLWASPPTIERGDHLKKTEELEKIKNAHSAEKLLGWINERIFKAYSVSDVAASSVGSCQHTEKMSATVHDTEEASATAFKIIIDEKVHARCALLLTCFEGMTTPALGETRALDLISATSCRSSSLQKVQEDFRRNAWKRIRDWLTIRG